MRKQVNRRALLKKTVLGSAAVTSALSLEGQALMAAMDKRKGPSTESDLTGDVKKAIDAGATGAFLIGNVGDLWAREGRVDLIGKVVDFIKQNGIIAGCGGLPVRRDVRFPGYRRCVDCKRYLIR